MILSLFAWSHQDLAWFEPMGGGKLYEKNLEIPSSDAKLSIFGIKFLSG